jgi:hypothetical protein
LKEFLLINFRQLNLWTVIYGQLLHDLRHKFGFILFAVAQRPEEAQNAQLI